MPEMLIGYARCSTEDQDLAAQTEALALCVSERNREQVERLGWQRLLARSGCARLLRQRDMWHTAYQDGA